METKDVKRGEKEPKAATKGAGPIVTNTPFWSGKAAYIVIGIAVVVVFLLFYRSPKDEDKTFVAPPSAQNATHASTQIAPTPTTPPVPTYKIGEPVAAGKFDIVATNYKTAAEFKTKYSVEKTENQFVIVDVKITNKDDRARDVSSRMFKLVDVDGKTYDPYDKTIVDDNVFLYETVNPGISRSKSVLFETPKDIKVAKLRVDSGVALAGGKPVDIDLNAK
ncbi:DUF4352 domain-containing protein [Paenibacillus sp. OAS669]|uniref:DUF4352 domain-containing protein n=1 Tax=Paenibacillus sp. OAS669 TaxID=2663821 RepID=UPI00178A743E|nr:DUF4352 domain-containing protein [Paenibacillus sp. OAS669]MBE1443907.1 hypothetical protein [Paenibacillus sp. OAS669]